MRASIDVLDSLDLLFSRRADDIEAWFAAREAGRCPPFYHSVDIRNAGYKVAVIDTNLFPAGFNNLCDYSYRLGAEQARAYFARHFPQVRKIFIIPESNTRNPGYVANLARLKAILRQAGFVCAVGTLIEAVPQAGAELDGLEGTKVILKPFEVRAGVPYIDGEPYDAVLLNHDLSGGEPPLVRDLGVPVIPKRILGWHRRRKSLHFAKLADMNVAFASAFGIDPWTLGAATDAVDAVDFDHPETLREPVERLFARLRQTYTERGIAERPYIFIKHDAGTYGIGVMALNDPADLDQLSRELRKKMKTGKGGVPITSAILQEGLPTRDRMRGCVGEPVIYAMNNRIIGGFFRMHCEVDDRSSLNKPGQIFARLCSTPTKAQSRSEVCYHDSRLFRVYGVLARLAGLAVLEERAEMEQMA